MTANSAWRAIVCCLALSAPALAQAPAPVTGDGWPQFRGNPRLTGIATSTPNVPLKLLWKYESGDSIDSSAAIANGVVYVGSLTGDLLAVDLATGALKWKYATGSSIGESSPAVTRDAVFVGDSSGVLHAVRPSDGTKLWTFKAGQEIKSSPVVVGAVVLTGSYDGYLYALDVATGNPHWKFETEGPVHATPAVRDGVIYIAGCDESFRAISLADGKELFKIPAGSNTAASPLLDGDRAYFGTFNNEVLAFDVKTKKIVWRYSNPDRQFPFYSSATIAGGRVVVGSRDKLVHAIDAATGKPSWTFTTRARVDSSPAVADGRVYIGSNDGRLYVLDVATGEKQWEFDTGAALGASPAIAGGRVVIGSADGVLYCFG
jgi:outer membrane protein assembly factor BamB